MLNPDAMTTVAPVERGNYIFISQGNLLSSIGYRPDLTPQRPYHIFPPQNIAEHFNTFNQPVPQGFESFNAVAEAYLFSEGIIYFVVNGDGSRYSFYTSRAKNPGPFLQKTNKLPLLH